MGLVGEHIEQFTRGGKNPFKTLKIGKRAQIENWFETWAPDTNYEIDDDLNIRVKESLNLYEGSNDTFLPNNLYIERYLDLRWSKITSLPDNLYIREWLDIRWTKITSLPDDLHVEGNLYIRETKITSLPDNLHVGEKILKDF